ncbi:uncharacterized protein P884DRAFT_258319 [Thermothelomyces heterothallicus CBS 202.75]|uniref:uncharacterized protein n=1 Tax=Thermothelomyces heterothallicus CBS 202.75 TaxID=1149848 RepID=UPI003742279B
MLPASPIVGRNLEEPPRQRLGAVPTVERTLRQHPTHQKLSSDMPCTTRGPPPSFRTYFSMLVCRFCPGIRNKCEHSFDALEARIPRYVRSPLSNGRGYFQSRKDGIEKRRIRSTRITVMLDLELYLPLCALFSLLSPQGRCMCFQSITECAP